VLKKHFLLLSVLKTVVLHNICVGTDIFFMSRKFKRTACI